jgi:hypothetical protein
VTSHDVENVYGAVGAAGFITRLSTKAKSWVGTPPPHYHYCKVLKLVPERQQLLKTYTEKGGSYGMQMIAFDDTRLITMGDRTKITFDIYMEAKSEAIAINPGAMAQQLEASRDGMAKNLSNLKRIVESR